MNAFQPKLIYLARRLPSLNPTEFTARWRQHGQLGMSLPRWANIARYVHCDLEPPSDPSTNIANDYDAIGLIWHKSPKHRRAHIADTSSRAAMEADEAMTFSRPINETCLVARETVLLRPPKRATWKLTHFSNVGSPSDNPPSMVGRVWNDPLPPENGVAWGLDYKRVEEFWFNTRADAENAALSIDGSGLLTLGREVQLYP